MLCKVTRSFCLIGPTADEQQTRTRNEHQFHYRAIRGTIPSALQIDPPAPGSNYETLLFSVNIHSSPHLWKMSYMQCWQSTVPPNFLKLRCQSIEHNAHKRGTEHASQQAGYFVKQNSGLPTLATRGLVYTYSYNLLHSDRTGERLTCSASSPPRLLGLIYSSKVHLLRCTCAILEAVRTLPDPSCHRVKYPELCYCPPSAAAGLLEDALH